jgi:hypothetical protein
MIPVSHAFPTGDVGLPVYALTKFVSRYTYANVLIAVVFGLQGAERARASGLSSSPAVTLLVVDSPAAVIAPVLGGGNQHSQGHALMMAVARMLRSLARRFNVAVLTTNHMVGGTNPGIGLLCWPPTFFWFYLLGLGHS